MKVPVALFIFNRPALSQRCLHEIRKYRPTDLVIICDGPRDFVPSDVEKVNKTRDIVQSGIDWPCNVFFDASDKNLGCGVRVSSGLDFVFSKFDRAIILEDDCIPTRSFFDFCEIGLDQFNENDEICSIAGTSFFDFHNSMPYLTKFPNIWGWASWRRVWEQYSYTMSGWKGFRSYEYDISKYLTYPQQRIFSELFNQKKSGAIDTWDIQFTEMALRRRMYSVNSGVNLISNIGFGADATHTLDPFNVLSDRESFDIDQNTVSAWFEHSPAKLSPVNESVLFNEVYTGGRSLGTSRLSFYFYRLFRKLTR